MSAKWIALVAKFWRSLSVKEFQRDLVWLKRNEISPTTPIWCVHSWMRYRCILSCVQEFEPDSLLERDMLKYPHSIQLRFSLGSTYLKQNDFTSKPLPSSSARAFHSCNIYYQPDKHLRRFKIRSREVPSIPPQRPPTIRSIKSTPNVTYRQHDKHRQFSAQVSSISELLHTPETLATTKPTSWLSSPTYNFWIWCSCIWMPYGYDRFYPNFQFCLPKLGH